MVPPQDRPTFQAVSSATPHSSIFGLPLSITSIASVTTAPSTQPPETDPRKLPSLSITRLEPTGRGADPHVSTTVATATSRPDLRHSSAVLRMSSSRASMKIPPSGDLSQHVFRVEAPARCARQGTSQIGHGLQIVNRPQFVNVRQHCLHAFGACFEAVKTKQRIQPDKPSARSMEPIDLEGERVVGIPLESIGNQQNHRTLREHTTRPLLVKCVQRGGDPSPSGPVGHICRTRGESFIRVTLADCTGYVRQPRAEQECGHTFAGVRYSVQEMQKQTGVLAHRAGNIE